MGGGVGPFIVKCVAKMPNSLRLTKRVVSVDWKAGG